MAGFGSDTGFVAAPPPPPQGAVAFDPAPPQGATPLAPPPPQGATPLASPSGPQPNILERGIMSLAANPVVQGLHGAYMEAGANDLFMQPVRMAMEASGYGLDRVKQLYPGQSDDFYRAKLHEFYGNAVDQVRQDAHNQVQQNLPQPDKPNGGRSLGNLVATGAQGGLNALAGLTATPEYFALPAALGGGAGKTAVARVATAAGGNAAIGAASNAAAQLLDLAEGQKKSFDVTQNLTQAAVGGVLGGGLQGAHEIAPPVSDFVKGLFGTRGVDTTPGVDPRASATRTPVTGSGPALSGTDQAQLKVLLKTGSVDEIKQFFADKQGPRPTFQDVNQLVRLRDQVPDTAVNSDNIHDAINAHVKEANRQVVQDHVDQQTANWKNAPNIEVVHGPEDIADPEIRAQALRDDQGADGSRALGFFGPDGTVRMYSGRVSTPERANSLLFHEGLGHFGLSEQFGSKLESTLTSLADRNVGQFGRDVAARQAANPGETRALSAEEVLAKYSEKGPLKKSIGDAVGATVRQFGRKMGLNLSYTDGEVRNILSMAHDAVINGKGRDVASNGYKSGPLVLGGEDGPATNKFMFTGPKASGFDPHDQSAYRAKDGIVRNEIDDFPSKFTPSLHLPGEDTKAPITASLGDMLDHPRLYQEYPGLQNLKVHSYDMGDRRLAGGYEDTDKSIHLNNTLPEAAQHTTLLHETQHAIQDIEQHPDFVRESKMGGTEHLSSEEYRESPSENEARATEDRQFLTPSMRNAEPPKFMREDTLEPKDVADEAFNRLEDNYVPTTRTWEQSLEMAKNTALNVENLKGTRSVGNLDKRLFQYDNAAKALNDKVMAAAEKASSGVQLTDAEHVDQLNSIAQFHYALGRIENDAGQVGRALNAMKAIQFSRNNLLNLRQALHDTGSTLEGLSDPDTLNKFLRQYQILGNAKGGQTLARDISNPGWEKYALTLYRNMLLSGLGTHIKAPMDMSTGIALDLEDRLGAIPIGKIHDALQAVGITKQGGMHGREPLGYLFGALKAVSDGTAWTNAMSALADPHSQTLRITNEAPAVLPGVLGQVSTVPTRLIAAQDAFFRAISTNAHLYGSGVARSLREGGEGLNWSDHLDRGVSYGQNPTDDERADASDKANHALLLSENPLTKFLERGKKIGGQNGTPDPLDRALTSVIDLLTPIIRVPANSLLSRVIARSPLALLDPETRAMLQAGGPQADIAISRALFGTLKLAGYWAAAGVVGNTVAGNRRKELEASGWRPDSVQEKDGNYSTGNQLAQSINPVDTHNSTATMVADIHEAYDKGANQGQIGTALKAAVGRTLQDSFNQLWIGDISRAQGLFSDSPQDASAPSRVLGGLVSGAVVPSFVAQARSFTDPNQHDTTVPDNLTASIGEQIKARIPGLSNSVPIRYSVYGDPLLSGANIVPTHNLVTGGNSVQRTTDPTKLELQRLSGLLQKNNPGSALITPVDRTVHLDDGTTKKLTTPEFENYQHIAGINIVAQVKQAMEDPSWQTLSDNDKAEQVKDIQKQVKAAAREALFNGQP